MISNILTGERYIGCTKNIKIRIESHCYPKGGGAKKLHAAIETYGVENFIVEILEFGLDKIQGLRIREPFWIQSLHPEYNITTGGVGVPGLKYDFTPEHREKIRRANIGKKLSPQTREKMREVHSHTYTIQTPTGEVIEVQRLPEWAKQHKISPGNIRHRGHSKGYIILQHHKETYRADEPCSQENRTNEILTQAGSGTPGAHTDS